MPERLMVLLVSKKRPVVGGALLLFLLVVIFGLKSCNRPDDLVGYYGLQQSPAEYSGQLPDLSLPADSVVQKPGALLSGAEGVGLKLEKPLTGPMTLSWVFEVDDLPQADQSFSLLKAFGIDRAEPFMALEMRVHSPQKAALELFLATSQTGTPLRAPLAMDGPVRLILSWGGDSGNVTLSQNGRVLIKSPWGDAPLPPIAQLKLAESDPSAQMFKRRVHEISLWSGLVAPERLALELRQMSQWAPVGLASRLILTLNRQNAGLAVTLWMLLWFGLAMLLARISKLPKAAAWRELPKFAPFVSWAFMGVVLWRGWLAYEANIFSTPLDSVDFSEYLTNMVRFEKGQIPYKDFIPLYQPLLGGLSFVFIHLLGGGFGGFLLFYYVVSPAIGALAVLWASHRHLGTTWAWAGFLGLLLAFDSLFLGWNSYSLRMLPLLLGIGLMSRVFQDQRTAYWLGGLMGLSMMHSVAFMGALGGTFALACLVGAFLLSARQVIATGLRVTVGFAAAMVPQIALLALTGIGQPFFDHAFGFLRSYAAVYFYIVPTLVHESSWSQTFYTLFYSPSHFFWWVLGVGLCLGGAVILQLWRHWPERASLLPTVILAAAASLAAQRLMVEPNRAMGMVWTLLLLAAVQFVTFQIQSSARRQVFWALLVCLALTNGRLVQSQIIGPLQNWAQLSSSQGPYPFAQRTLKALETINEGIEGLSQKGLALPERLERFIAARELYPMLERLDDKEALLEELQRPPKVGISQIENLALLVRLAADSPGLTGPLAIYPWGGEYFFFLDIEPGSPANTFGHHAQKHEFNLAYLEQSAPQTVWLSLQNNLGLAAVGARGDIPFYYGWQEPISPAFSSMNPVKKYLLEYYRSVERHPTHLVLQRRAQKRPYPEGEQVVASFGPEAFLVEPGDCSGCFFFHLKPDQALPPLAGRISIWFDFDYGPFGRWMNQTYFDGSLVIEETNNQKREYGLSNNWANLQGNPIRIEAYTRPIAPVGLKGRLKTDLNLFNRGPGRVQIKEVRFSFPRDKKEVQPYLVP